MEYPSGTEEPRAAHAHKSARHAIRVAGLKHEPKLNWQQVNDIRRTYVFRSSTHGTPGLAKKYGVSANTIHEIVRGKKWKPTEGDGNVAPPLKDRPSMKDFQRALGRSDALRRDLELLIKR